MTSLLLVRLGEQLESGYLDIQSENTLPSALHGSGGWLRVMGLGIAGMGTGPEFETRTNPYP